jgi:hypothetical protein
MEYGDDVIEDAAVVAVLVDDDVVGVDLDDVTRI